MTIINRLVTRGMGISHAGVGTAGLITRGLGGDLFGAVVEAGRRIVHAGRSAAKKQLDQVILFLKLIRVNGQSVDSEMMIAVAIKENNAIVTAKSDVIVEQVNDVVIDVKLID